MRGNTHHWEIATLAISSWDNAKAVAKLAKALVYLFSFLGICSNVKASKFASKLLRICAMRDKVFFLNDVLLQDLDDN